MFQPIIGVNGVDKKPDIIQEKELVLREGVNLEQYIQRLEMSEKRILESSNNFEGKVDAETRSVVEVKEKPKLHGSLKGMKAFDAYVGDKGYYMAEQIKAQEEKELAEAQGTTEGKIGEVKEDQDIKKTEVLTSAIEGKIDDNFKKSPDWQSLSEQEKLMYEWVNGMKIELENIGLSQAEITNFFTNKTFGYLLTSVDLNPLQEKDRPNVVALKEAIGSFYKNSDGTLKGNVFSLEIVDDTTKNIFGKINEFSPQISKEALMQYAGYDLTSEYKPVGNAESLNEYENLNMTSDPELNKIFIQGDNVRIEDSYYDFLVGRIDGATKMEPSQGELFKWLNKLVNVELPAQGVSKESLRSVFLNKNYEGLLTGVGSKLENKNLLDVLNLENELRKRNIPQVETVISNLYLLVGNLHGSPDLADKMKKYKAGEYNGELAH